MTAEEVLNRSVIVPVIAIENEEDALPLAEALLAGGIEVMEITLRTKAALKAIKIIAQRLPQMAVGAGTVMDANDVRDAVKHGAAFLFSPGIHLDIITEAKMLNIPLIPGVATASEVMLAKNSGLRYCKLFPATLVGGVEILQAFQGPFPMMHFCPTGGVNLHNMPTFLKLKNVPCVGGSWIVPSQAIQSKSFETVTTLCKEALRKLNSY